MKSNERDKFIQEYVQCMYNNKRERGRYRERKGERETRLKFYKYSCQVTTTDPSLHTPIYLSKTRSVNLQVTSNFRSTFIFLSFRVTPPAIPIPCPFSHLSVSLLPPFLFLVPFLTFL